MNHPSRRIHPLLGLAFRAARRILHSRPAIAFLGLSRRFTPGLLNGWLDISHHTLELRGLPAAFDGLRLVQISDLHLGTWINRQLLAEAVQVVNQQLPDVVVITGDFVTFDPAHFAPTLTAELSQISAPCGVFAVLGNHDHWAGARIVRRALTQAGITVLRNQAIPVERGAERLYLCGLDSAAAEMDDFPLLFESLPNGAAAILLAHEPDVADEAASYERFMLQLSGHSHGGQVVLPLIGAPITPRLGRKYRSGLYMINGMQQYTNRGLGAAELHLRFNCPPEITVFELRRSPPDNGKLHSPER
jgi:predicted MPP superfamily phosphohydrolase